MWTYLVVISYLAKSISSFDEKLIRIAQGPVRGRKETEDVYAFYGIPYATAPTGEDKFKAPLPPPTWIKPYDAIDKGIICPQPDFGTDIFVKVKNMQEDCLICNVYIPDTEEIHLPVVVFIHGGAFQVGAGNRRKALNLTRGKRLISITFNYRLGVIGFLCLGTKDIPGNAGMKDIVALLRWVQTNIQSFGGNPNDVTVSGYSSGAIAADLLILSESARGLFNKVIIESGSNLADFAIQSEPIRRAQTYAEKLEFKEADDISKLELFYKRETYLRFTEEPLINEKYSTIIFAPCIERDVGGEIFLHDSPINILKSGNFTRVPMLYGFTNMEGLVRVPFFDLWKSDLDKNFSNYLPNDLEFDNDDERQNIAKQVREFYFKDETINDSSILDFVDYITDVMFSSPALRSVSLNVAAGNSEIYLYHYAFSDDYDPFVPYTKVRGANHCAQSLAIFDDLVPRKMSNKFTIMRRYIRKMWYFFITTGAPVPKLWTSTVKWPPTNVDRTPHMYFGETIRLAGKLLEKRGQFWDKIYEKYYRQPEPPSLTKGQKCRKSKKPITMLSILTLNSTSITTPLNITTSEKLESSTETTVTEQTTQSSTTIPISSSIPIKDIMQKRINNGQSQHWL